MQVRASPGERGASEGLLGGCARVSPATSCLAPRGCLICFSGRFLLPVPNAARAWVTVAAALAPRFVSERAKVLCWCLGALGGPWEGPGAGAVFLPFGTQVVVRALLCSRRKNKLVSVPCAVTRGVMVTKIIKINQIVMMYMKITSHKGFFKCFLCEEL